ncbi:MAG: arsenic resistance N-acetyltransferase ArsN2 [Candidatus Thorarchaeota archaeon]
MKSNYKLVKATKKDLTSTYSLLKQFNLPIEGIEKHLENFFVIKDGNLIIGVGGLEVYEEVGLLRSIAVNPKYQKQGLGRLIIEHLMDYAKRKRNINNLFLLTDTVPKLYEKFGFKYIKRNDVNPKITQSEEFKGSCPYTADAMVKVLN